MTHRMTHRWSAFFLASLLFPPVQRPGTIRGMVVADADGRELAGVMVTVDAGRRTASDEEGRFELSGLVAGPYRIAAVTPGCHVALGEVEVPEGDTVTVLLRVALPAEADPEGWTDAERRQGSSVRVITAEEIERRHVRSVQDAIRLVAPDMVGLESGQAGGRQQIQGRGRSTVAGTTEPLLVVDGVRIMGRVVDVLSTLDPENIRRIEVVRGTAGAWVHGTQAVNGVIRIFTRNRHDPPPLDMPPERCDFRFPDGAVSAPR